MITRIKTVAFDGIQVKEVDVQVSISKGLPFFSIVGLADKSVSESKERLRSAFHSLGFALPAARITVNLSPADIIKDGSHFDLPIALGILGALDVIPSEDLINYIALGEIALDGNIIPVNGVLASAYFANQNNKGIIFPGQQLEEIFLVRNTIEIIPANNLVQIVKYFKEGIPIKYDANIKPKQNPIEFTKLEHIKGHVTAKRVLEIAAAGKHNLLMIGSPGSGKSMLANALGSILPPLSTEEILDINLIYSITGNMHSTSLITERPYRAPHHSTSMPALIGGGTKAKAGEITFAHHGILFLDELPEFQSHIIDSLRQPIETGKIHISRANANTLYPANFQLIAAMNPCKCGYFGEEDRSCSRAPLCAEQYQSKISGPILDRIDLVIEVPQVKLHEEMFIKSPTVTSEEIKAKVIKAREIQETRYKQHNIKTNSECSSNLIEEVVNLTSDAKKILNQATEKFKLSNRAYYRVMKTARTIADLAGSKEVNYFHMSEAITYRKINYYRKSLEPLT